MPQGWFSKPVFAGGAKDTRSRRLAKEILSGSGKSGFPCSPGGRFCVLFGIMEFLFQSKVRAPRSLLEEWHHRPGALARLTPPGQPVEVLEAASEIKEGSRAEMRVRMLPGFWTNWTAEHINVHRGEGFTDVQVQGPFRNWVHVHQFLADPEDNEGSLLRDHVICEPFGGAVGRMLAAPFLRRRLNRLFAWRHARTIADVETLQRNPPARPLHFLITGAGGMIGRALVPYLRQAGHRVTTLSRAASGPHARVWDPERGHIDLAGLDPVDAVVHLAGENIARGSWTAERRRRILLSRETGTRLLADAVAKLSPKPACFISASGVSAYRADGRPKDETSSLDTASFLGHVVQAWEAAARPAKDAGIRVVHLRFGIVLGPDGGALSRLLPIFRAGLGGPVWHGKMGFPWIALDDVLELIHQAAQDNRYEGPINGVAPEPATNADFSSTLARVLHRPCLVPVPRQAVLWLFGQMGEETILADLKVLPAKLESLRFPYRFPNLEPALRHLLLENLPIPAVPPKPRT
jgi:uncharacterized protein (TIGR01777 family)